MSISLQQHVPKLIAAALAVSTMATIGAAAIEQPAAVLSSNLNSSVGTVLTADAIMTAERALAKAKAEANANLDAATIAKAEADAKAKAEAEEKAKAEEEAMAVYNELLTAPISSKTVDYSESLAASDLVKQNATALGNFQLTFYCPCSICNGEFANGITASGNTMLEGRTIAVDTSVIPLGSRVYIDGFGVFIAEDTGGAIQNSKIDICVSSHERAYELGVKNADVYLLS